MTSKFIEAQFDKVGFLGLIQEFLNKVDELAPTGKTTGSKPSNLEKAMNEILRNFDYVCSVSFGQGGLSSAPSISFCPKKILSKNLANGEKLSAKRGIFIWLGYDYNKNQITLLIGWGDESEKHRLAEKIWAEKRANGEWEFSYNRKDFEKEKDKIAEDFLGLVNEFNQIPLEDFKIERQETWQNGDKSPSYWIFPSNPSEFDAVSHFKTHEQKSWEKKVANAKVGDIVFLYITKTDKEHSQSIAIKTKIIDIDESKPLPIMLEIDRLFTHPVPFSYLQEIGINGNIQGARNITKNQADKILFYAQNSNNKGQTMPNSHKTPPLNQILYGPPGTGKTYSTINRALEILHAYGEITQIPSERSEAKAEFDRFRKAGQIEFVTFHQSFSYEEFVEGIKPETTENGEMTYEIRDGIFKEICDNALSNIQAYNEFKATAPKQISTKELFQAFAQNIQEQLTNTGKSVDFNTPSLSTKMRISKVLYFKNDEARTIVISTPNSTTSQTLKRDIVLRDYEKFKSGEIQSHRDIKPTFESSAQWHGNSIYYFALYEKIAEFEKSYKPQIKSPSEVKLKPYILIIDEINRGNISKILGELITLIEPSKRIGASADERTRGVGDEGLRVSLPYSGREFDGGKGFGVPSNLYIIGTMNTADRSIALLDTALRRRFEFVEMMPRAEFLGGAECDGVNLQNLLEKMNERIEFLLDREHTIGHSFFIGVGSLAALRGVFANKIIPLLQEYFYDDYAKIDAVLNDNKMVKSHSMSELGVKISEDLIDNDKKIYRITKPSEWQLEHFTKIYE